MYVDLIWYLSNISIELQRKTQVFILFILILLAPHAMF